MDGGPAVAELTCSKNLGPMRVEVQKRGERSSGEAQQAAGSLSQRGGAEGWGHSLSGR